MRKRVNIQCNRKCRYTIELLKIRNRAVRGLFLGYSSLIRNNANSCEKHHRLKHFHTNVTKNNLNDITRDHSRPSKTDCQCKIKETWFIQEMQPAFYVNVNSSTV